jgi:hypothetical protein
MSALAGTDLTPAAILRFLILPVALPFALRTFFGQRLTIGGARTQLAGALETREARFLDMIRTHVYDRPRSPYRRLLELAGCTYTDLQALVRREGLEGALRELARHGVYLTAAEFKGKEPVVRGNTVFHVYPGELERGVFTPGLMSQSSGSSDLPVRSFTHLDWLTQEAATVAVFLQAHGLLAHAFAAYEPVLPGCGGVVFMMMLTRLGIGCERWFARQVPIETRLERAYDHLIAYELALAGRWFGPGFPKPESVGIEDLSRIVHWVEAHHRAGTPCCIRTVASNAARIARVALDGGASLAGATFIATGEPLTNAKRRVIEQAGACATPTYGCEPLGRVGFGCARPSAIDDLHVSEQTLAVIEHPLPLDRGEGSIHPLLFTTLYPSASKLHLNVANGDEGHLERRNCACALGAAGLTLHLHQLRSYEKFTSEGLNYAFSDLSELVETTLPAEFGGGIGDYQLCEEEDPGGQTRLSLLVHPRIGSLDEERLLARLQQGLANGSRGNRFMAGVWTAARTLRIRREAPVVSPRGKILPIRVAGRRLSDRPAAR